MIETSIERLYYIDNALTTVDTYSNKPYHSPLVTMSNKVRTQQPEGYHQNSLYMFHQIICVKYMRYDDLCVLMSKVPVQYRITSEDYKSIRSSAPSYEDETTDLFIDTYLSSHQNPNSILVQEFAGIFPDNLEDVEAFLTDYYSARLADRLQPSRSKYYTMETIDGIKVLGDLTHGDISNRYGKVFRRTCLDRLSTNTTFKQSQIIDSLIIHMMRCKADVHDIAPFLYGDHKFLHSHIYNALREYGYMRALAYIGSNDSWIIERFGNVTAFLNCTIEERDAILNNIEGFKFKGIDLMYLSSMNNVPGLLDKYIKIYLSTVDECTEYMTEHLIRCITRDVVSYEKLFKHCIKVINPDHEFLRINLQMAFNNAIVNACGSAYFGYHNRPLHKQDNPNPSRRPETVAADKRTLEARIDIANSIIMLGHVSLDDAYQHLKRSRWYNEYQEYGFRYVESELVHLYR